MAYHHAIDLQRCKGCGLCVAICPKQVLELSEQVTPKGYFPAFRARPEDCIYCAMCAGMCPDVAITIEAVDEASTE